MPVSRAENDSTMMGAVFHGPNRVSVSPVPRPGGRIRVRIKACAVCGYDVRVFRNGHRKVTPPVILGHEICGELVDEVNTDSVYIRPGTRVSVYPQVPCLNCSYCADGSYNLCMNLRELGSSVNGGFAEYMEIPEEIARIGGLVPVPDRLGDEEAALLEPLACCINSLSRMRLLTEDARKNSIVIIGDGPIALMHLQLFRRLVNTSAIAVVGRIVGRMQKARFYGADHVVEYSDLEATAKSVLDFGLGPGASIVVVATSNPEALELAKLIVGRNSVINLFAGMPQDHKLLLESNWLHYNQVSVLGTFGCTPATLARAAELASSGQVDLSNLVTKRYALSEIEQALSDTEKYSALRAVVNRF